MDNAGFLGLHLDLSGEIIGLDSTIYRKRRAAFIRSGNFRLANRSLGLSLVQKRCQAIHDFPLSKWLVQVVLFRESQRRQWPSFPHPPPLGAP